MNRDILEEDIFQFSCLYDDLNPLRNSKFLITGSTGLIGSVIVRCLLALNRKYSLNLTIYCPVRDLEKAMLNINCKEPAIVYTKLSEISVLPSQILGGEVDYIIHCAAPTKSNNFVTMPIETIQSITGLTERMLLLSKEMNVKSVVYVSSLEVYGQILDDSTVVTEDMQGYINPLDARSSYSLGKRMAELLCYSYFKERNLPVKIARLTQTFGPGVPQTENRVFAQFARSTMQGNDIILSTEGKSAKPYCYTTDAVSAILTILTKGENGEAYNVSNDDTYISIKDMAEKVVKEFNNKIKVVVELDSTKGYAPDTKLRLSSDKLKSLGWTPRYDLHTMFDRLIKYML